MLSEIEIVMMIRKTEMLLGQKNVRVYNAAITYVCIVYVRGVFTKVKNLRSLSLNLLPRSEQAERHDPNKNTRRIECF